MLSLCMQHKILDVTPALFSITTSSAVVRLLQRIPPTFIAPRSLIRHLQRLVHELPLDEAEPVLARRRLVLGIHTVQQPHGKLLTHLCEILAKGLGVIAVGGGLERLVEREAGIAGDGEVGVEGEVHQGLQVSHRSSVSIRPITTNLHTAIILCPVSPAHSPNEIPCFIPPGLCRFVYVGSTHLLGVPFAHARLDDAQGLADEEDAIDEDAVGGALDLKVAEEGVGAEEGEDLVDGVVRLVRRLDRQLRHVGGQRGQLQRRAARAGAQRQQREVACSEKGNICVSGRLVPDMCAMVASGAALGGVGGCASCGSVVVPAGSWRGLRRERVPIMCWLGSSRKTEW